MVEPVHDHLSVGANAEGGGKYWHVGPPAGCGRHWPRVGSQNSVGLQSTESMHGPSGVTHACERQIWLAAQHVPPQCSWFFDGHGATHAPSMHSSPVAQ